MNSIRILRLSGEKRTEYVRHELEKKTPRELKKILKSYGVKDMQNKTEMVDFLTKSLLDWAYRTELGLEALANG